MLIMWKRLFLFATQYSIPTDFNPLWNRTINLLRPTNSQCEIISTRQLKQQQRTRTGDRISDKHFIEATNLKNKSKYHTLTVRESKLLAIRQKISRKKNVNT